MNNKEIMEMFQQNKNHFEYMASFADTKMKEAAKEVKKHLDRFIETGDLKEFLNVKFDYEQMVQYMNARDMMVTHNPDRGTRY